MTSKIEGLVAATYLPLHPDGTLNLELVPQIVAHLQASGCTGIYINGSTGEGVSLSSEERRAVAEAYVQAAQGKLKTVIQVGHESVAEAAGLAAHAASLQVDAISATPPCYFKPSTVRGLLDFLVPVVEAAGDTPFYYYHIPALTGVSIDALEFLEQGSSRLPSLAGIKYSHLDLSTLLACLRHEEGRFDMLFGSDENLLGSLAVGCQGAVGSTYNFAAPIYTKVIEAFNKGDMEAAREWQSRSVIMVRILIETCGRAGLKAAMGFIGLDCGPHRLPIPNAAPGQIEECRQRLEAVGFFDWIGPSGN